MDRLPPQAKEAERELIGCLLRHPEKLSDVRDLVSADDWYFDGHRRVYGSILRLADSGRPFDLVGVRNELQGRGELADVGGDEYLADLSGAGGYAHEWNVKRIHDAAVRRESIRAAAELIESSYSGSAPADQLLEELRGRLDRLANRVAGCESIPIADAINQLLEDIDRRARGEAPSGTPTGFAETDANMCGGLPPGGLIVLAARPSVGKTSWACHVTRNVCQRGGAVLFVSLEQSRGELTERITAGDAQVNGKRLRTGQLEPRHHQAISQSANRTRSWRMRIDDKRSRTAGQIAAGARTAKRKLGGLDLVVIDYLDLVWPDNMKATRNDQVGTSTRRLRDMAGELNCPVLLLCQLNREAAGEDKGPPRLHHLRNSGEIEQHADAVLFLHRVGPVPTAGMKDALELHIAKQRNGPLGVIEYQHESRVYTFAEMPRVLIGT